MGSRDREQDPPHSRVGDLESQNPVSSPGPGFSKFLMALSP